MGDLVRGTHGQSARLLVALGQVEAPTGLCLIFAGISASDGELETRCEAQCVAAGYASARIGPNSDRDPNDRRTCFVACICEGAGKPPREFRAERGDERDSPR